MFYSNLTKTIALSVGVLAMVFLISYFVLAWTEPTVAPPGDNVPAPLNVSLNAQSKEGALVLANNSGVTTGLIVRYGNVGIGTTTPGYKLDVAGDINIPSTGFLRIAGSAGSSGQVLTRTASGMTWQNATGAGGGYWAASGDDIYNTNTDDVGIGTDTPLSPLHVSDPSKWITLRLSRMGNPLDLKHRFLGVFSDGSLVIGKIDDANMLASDHMVIDTDGNVGLGTEAGRVPQAKLDVRANWTAGVTRPLEWLFQSASYGMGVPPLALRIGIKTDAVVANQHGAIEVDEGGIKRPLVLQPTSGNVGIGTTGPNFKLEVAGDVGADAFYYLSDISLKENIKPLENGLAKILQLNGISYQMKETGQERLGFSAQEVAEVFPEAVNQDKEGILSLEASGLIAALVEAVKTQQTQINELKAEIEQLKNQ